MRSAPEDSVSRNPGRREKKKIAIRVSGGSRNPKMTIQIQSAIVLCASRVSRAWV